MKVVEVSVTELVAFAECEQKGEFLRQASQKEKLRQEAKARGTLAHAIVERQNKESIKKGDENGIG